MYNFFFIFLYIQIKSFKIDYFKTVLSVFLRLKYQLQISQDITKFYVTSSVL